MIFFVPLGFQKILLPSEVYRGLLPIFKMEPFAKIAFVAKSPISDSGKCTGSSDALYFAITLDWNKAISQTPKSFAMNAIEV